MNTMMLICPQDDAKRAPRALHEAILASFWDHWGPVAGDCGLQNPSKAVEIMYAPSIVSYFDILLPIASCNC